MNLPFVDATRQQIADSNYAEIGRAVRLLLDTVAAYLPCNQVDEIDAAVHYGAYAHAGVRRKSGEPYIAHPVAVAQELTALRLDSETLIAAILHDVVEDTDVDLEAITTRFGPRVAALVDGVTKLEQVSFSTREHANAESFRKLIMAMARDVRVILIKLCDRLHNLLTIDAKSPPRRRAIGHETIEIYAKIAYRLGMQDFKRRLEDLGLYAMHPWRHRVLTARLKTDDGELKVELDGLLERLRAHFKAHGLDARVQARVKSVYSVYEKMRQSRLRFAEVLDVHGLRVIVGSREQCYLALGLAHALFKPQPGRFKDFIAIPKENGYQSLHTVLKAPGSERPLELQIRTEDMDQVAEHGIAAHWLYKTESASSDSAQNLARRWLVELLSSQEQTQEPLEFFDNLRVDLSPDDVYVFTPNGDIIALPRGGTVLDFAYAVHTGVGHHAVAARVDRQFVPLRTVLRSGQTVEIVTAESSEPVPSWLDFVITSRARTAIRHYLRQLQHSDAVRFGHRMLDHALEALDSSLDAISPEQLDRFLLEHRLKSLEALLLDIALGNRVASFTARQMLAAAPATDTQHAPPPMQLTGGEGTVVSYGSCCLPIPQDPVMGYLVPGKGVTIHRATCSHVVRYKRAPESCLSVEWSPEVKALFRCRIRVEVTNGRGVLAKVAAAISETETNIAHVEYPERDDKLAALLFTIEIADRRNLARVMRRVRRVAEVINIARD